MKAVLVDSQIKKFINKKIISDKKHNLSKFVQPSSLDIPLGQVAYNVKRSVVPVNSTVLETLEDNVIEEIDLTKGGILKKHNTYLVPTVKLNLPKNVFVKSSPKSSIGRIDVLVRTLVDNLGFYEVISDTVSSVVWLEITPQSFHIKVKSGIPMTQLQFFSNDNDLDLAGLEKTRITNSRINLPFIEDSHEVLTLHVGNKTNTGYIAKQTNEVVDLTKRDNKASKFFEPITDIKKKSILLEKGHFYILRTHEKIFVSKEFSGEMIPYSNMFGELRVHYAGYFDPGFGVDNSGNKFGNYGVLEVRPFENIKVSHKQPVCLMRKLYNYEIPKKLYGYSKNNYSSQQGVKLAKYFIL